MKRLILLALMAAPGLSLAAGPKVSQAPAVQAVVECRKVGDTVQRLACFDAAAAKLDEAQAKGDLVSIDREQRRSLRRETFGFALPSLAIFDKGVAADEASAQTFKVTRASLDREGRWRIDLEGGGTWDQTDSNTLLHDPKPGSQALVKKGALGSFDMKVDGQPSIRVRRER